MTEEVNCIQIACKNVHKSFCIVFVEKIKQSITILKISFKFKTNILI